jgi:signal peptidase
MERVRQVLKWNQRSELVKTVFVLGLVVVGTLSGYGLFMLAMGTSSPLVVVTSGSMEPTLYRGDLLAIQHRNAEDINLLDVVVYLDTQSIWGSEGPIVHRVVQIEVVNGTYHFYTQGDNNAVMDPGDRTIDEIVGVVVGVVPWIGNISLFLRTTEGMILTAVIFVLILIVPEFVCTEEEEEATSGSDHDSQEQPRAPDPLS